MRGAGDLHEHEVHGFLGREDIGIQPAHERPSHESHQKQSFLQADEPSEDAPIIRRRSQPPPIKGHSSAGQNEGEQPEYSRVVSESGDAAQPPVGEEDQQQAKRLREAVASVRKRSKEKCRQGQRSQAQQFDGEQPLQPLEGEYMSQIVHEASHPLLGR